MDLQQLYNYLGDLIEAGTAKTLPVVIPGRDADSLPVEVSEAMLIEGKYDADPAPLAPGQYHRTEACLLLAGGDFDLGELSESHKPKWPPVDTPTPIRNS